MQLSLGNHTSVGRVRTANEDAFGNWLTPNGHLFVVCDGMGGHIGGAIASQQAVAAIYQTMAAQQYPAAPVALEYCLEEANKKLRGMVDANPSLHGMGTTAVVVLVQGNLAFYAHIGDSRLYLFRQNTLRRLTRDHSFVQSLVDQGHISEEEAENHPRRNEIYRALGIQDTVSPTVSQTPLTLEPGDRLILCTDGLNGMIGDKGISGVLSERGLSVQQQSEKLVQLADEAGGHDNTTVQIIHARPVAQPIAAPAPVEVAQATAPVVTPEPTLPSVPENMQRADAPVRKPQESSQRSRDAFMRVEEKEKPKKPLLPIIGGIALFAALVLILYSFFSTPDTPRLGMETPEISDTTTETVSPTTDTSTTTTTTPQEPVQKPTPDPDPALVPPPDISTPDEPVSSPTNDNTDDAEPKMADTTKRAVKKAVAPKPQPTTPKTPKPKVEAKKSTPPTAKPKTIAPERPVSTPAPKPKPEETPTPRPKAVMPPPEP